MKFWIGPIGGALITVVYGTLSLSEQWNIGGEHTFRASGTLLAYALVGAFIGLIMSGLWYSAVQHEVPGSDSLPEEPNQTLYHEDSLRLVDAASDTEQGCPVTRAAPDTTKVQRIRPQVEALQRALDAELSFTEILRVLSDARSAINELSAELVGDYVRIQVSSVHDSATDRSQTVQEMVDAMRSCLK